MKKRDLRIDFLKGVAILGVVLFHFGGGYFTLWLFRCRCFPSDQRIFNDERNPRFYGKGRFFLLGIYR